VSGAKLDDGDDLLRGPGQNNGGGQIFFKGVGVALVNQQLIRFRDHAILAHNRPQFLRERGRPALH